MTWPRLTLWLIQKGAESQPCIRRLRPERPRAFPRETLSYGVGDWPPRTLGKRCIGRRHGDRSECLQCASASRGAPRLRLRGLPLLLVAPRLLARGGLGRQD